MVPLAWEPIKRADDREAAELGIKAGDAVQVGGADGDVLGRRGGGVDGARMTVCSGVAGLERGIGAAQGGREDADERLQDDVLGVDAGQDGHDVADSCGGDRLGRSSGTGSPAFPGRRRQRW